MADIERDLVHIVRLFYNNHPEDVAMMVRKTLPRIVKRRPDLSTEIKQILSRIPVATLSRSTSLAEPLPVDIDSRLELLRSENEPALEVEPIWPLQISDQLNEIIYERKNEKELRKAGVEPTKTILFIGPPGTGKSLAARWLAKQLRYPLLTLDLSAVISSFLGRTGNNLRVVLDYARGGQSVLLLDEFDAIAKRRDDTLEVGELKRLVTVLLQEIDSWPSQGLLIAATNHPHLLDPAVWRRFDRIIEFQLSQKNDIERLLLALIPKADLNGVNASLIAEILDGSSFADVTKIITTSKRASLVRGTSLSRTLIEYAAENPINKSTKNKITLAIMLKSQGMSQRQIAPLVGLSRDTLRRHLYNTDPNEIDEE